MTLDWDDLRVFLAIVRHGNLSAAAKDLRIAQSTTGRRLASLETGLGVRLLNRTPDGYIVTLAGQDVRKHAERLEAEALALERSVGGHDIRLAGAVRVAAPEALASQLLASCAIELHTSHPDIMIELLVGAHEPNLAMREADVSMRLAPPNKNDLVTRRIGTISFGLYASPAYLDRAGGLAAELGCPGHRLITQLGDSYEAAQADWLARLAPRARVSLQTNTQEAAVAATLQGGGLACLACFRADRETGLVRVKPRSPPPSAGIWLIVHRDNRNVPRIRAVLSHIKASVEAQAHTLSPAP